MRIYILPIYNWPLTPTIRSLHRRRSWQPDKITHVALVRHEYPHTPTKLQPVFYNTITDKHRSKYSALVALLITGDAELWEIEG